MMSRPDSAKKDLTPKLTIDQYKTLSKMYSQQNLQSLLKSTEMKKKIQSSPRTNTPKSCRTAQELFQQKYFLPQKQTLSKETKLQNSSGFSQKLYPSSQYRNLSNLNLSTGKESPKVTYSQQLLKQKGQANTDRKYHLFAPDMKKEPSRLSSHQIVAQMAQNILKQKDAAVKNKAKENIQFSLDDFVTQIQRSPAVRSSGIKQTKSLSPNQRAISGSNRFMYYVTNIQEAHKNGSMHGAQLYRDHAQQTFNCIGFCLNLSLASMEAIELRRVHVPMREVKFKKMVVFDLDETLIHCNENQSLKADIQLPITFPSGDTVQAGINIRPFAKWILVALAQVCEVVIFTASHQCYASKVIDYLDNTKCVQARLFRDKCVVSDDGVHIKDLRVIDRDPQDIVLVDNAAYSFGTAIENGIPIIPYYDDKADLELKHLYEFLVSHVLPAKDCRTVLQETFRLREYAQFVGPKSAIEKLYN